ncbi:MAG: hypothetical protein PHS41_01710 [Victivallaceae bacterium]|nr:hypothetical protein [Victivallaceae bacterium]
MDSPTFRVENSSFTADFVDPDATTDWQYYGRRFLRGGWLRDLRFHGNNARLLESNSIHDRHPIFGVPFEFYPALELARSGPKRSTLFHIGVGVLNEEADGRFETKPKLFFPWRTAKEVTSAGTRLVFRQSSGEKLYRQYAYDLSVTVLLPASGSSIE